MRIATWLGAVAIAAALAMPGTARAGNSGFFVTYDSEIDEGEFELMIMNDITAPSKLRREEGLGDYASQMFELEYGITNRIASEFMVETFQDFESGKRKFTGFRWETRARVFEREVPLNPMVYAEYEDLDPSTRYKMEVSGWTRPPYAKTEGEIDRERILESRLVLSDRIGPVGVAFNWINETDLDAGGETAFGYSLGVVWSPRSAGGHAHQSSQVVDGTLTHAGHGAVASSAMPRVRHVALGLEMYGGLGDSRKLGLDPSRQEHYLGPFVMADLGGSWMAHAQLAIGLTGTSDNLVRLALGYEF